MIDRHGELVDKRLKLIDRHGELVDKGLKSIDRRGNRWIDRRIWWIARKNGLIDRANGLIVPAPRLIKLSKHKNKNRTPIGRTYHTPKISPFHKKSEASPSLK